MAIPGADPAAQLKKISAEVQEKFDEAGMDQVEKFTDKIDGIIETAKSGPKEMMEAAKAKFEEFKNQIDAMLKDPASLAPSGGMAACADFYGKSVAGKLGALKDETESLAGSITKVASDMEGPLKNLGDTLTKAMEKLEGSLKALGKLPKLITKEIQGKDSPDDIAKINTGPMKKALDCGDVDGPIGMIMGLKDVLGGAVDAIKAGVAQLMDFIERAPDMVRGAFDVPKPFCFLTSVLMSQAPKAMTDLLGMIDKLKQIKLQPIVGMLEDVMETIGNLNPDKVKVPMNKFLESAGELVDRLDKTVQGAKMAGNPAGAVASVGSMI